MNDGKSTISKQLVEIFENVMQVEHEFVNTNVGKKLSGIDHIFIYIVEVVEKGFSQWNKFIETLFLRT